MQIRMADEESKKNGWTFKLADLNELEMIIFNEVDAPYENDLQTEDIERVLIALNNYGLLKIGRENGKK